MLEREDLDAELAGRVLVEDPLRGVRVVVVAHAGVVAPDDEVRAAVVAADQAWNTASLGPAYRIHAGLTASRVRSAG